METECSHKGMRERESDSNLLLQVCSPVLTLWPPCNGDSSSVRGNGRDISP